jgi:ketosteroid isomerase-like protein
VSENLDLVRSIFADWERGDFSSVEWAHPEIDYVFADGPSPGRWTGLSGMAEGWRNFGSAWEQFRSEADEYRDLDAESVLVLSHSSGRGKASRVQIAEMRSDGAHVFQLRCGKVTRLVIYWDRDRALGDLGLEE